MLHLHDHFTFTVRSIGNVIIIIGRLFIQIHKFMKKLSYESFYSHNVLTIEAVSDPYYYWHMFLYG